MKTIYTSLPIYDKVAKQCFERGKKGGVDRVVPILCPRHRLPSFQWLDNGDGAASVSKIEMLGKDHTGAEEVLATGWTGSSYDTFTTSGLTVTSAISTGVSGASLEPSFIPTIGEEIRFKAFLTLNSGEIPYLYHFYNSDPGEYLVAGANDILLPASYPHSSTAMIYNTVASNFALSNVSLTKITGIYDLEPYFPALPVAHAVTGNTYFTYEGDTLNYLLPVGLYYLKITMDTGHVYYSEWFLVDCVYENLISSWANVGYNTFTSLGTVITSAIETGISGIANQATPFNVIKGEVITVITFLTLNSGQAPSMQLNTGSGGASNVVLLAAGLNVITLTTTVAGSVYLHIYNDLASNFFTSEVIVNRSYSEKYLTINYSNTCDLGDILYHEGLTQTIWFESETMEPEFPQEEEGLKDGENRYVSTFSRQVKKYTVRTKDMPGFMADVFYRMKLHDTVELIDLVGDANDVYNLEVEHEWLWDDKYYAKFTLKLDYNEVFVIGGCCNNIA